MKFDFCSEEMSVVLLSLIQRRLHLKSMLTHTVFSAMFSTYTKELETIENLIERMFPGSMNPILAAEKAA